MINEMSAQKRGEYAEFVYLYFVRSKKIIASKTQYKEIDVTLNIDDKNIYIDVKSTISKNKRYLGKRPRKDAFYDYVSISDTYTKIYPDKGSPLEKYENIIFDTKEMLDKWKKSKPEKRIEKHDRKIILNSIKDILLKLNLDKQIRVVSRGPVSLSGWTSHPDNVPGKESTYKKFDYTIFIQFKYQDEKNNDYSEIVSKIYIFKHSEFNGKIQLKDADNRQKINKIYKVLDWDYFDKNFQNQIFYSIQELKSYILKIKS